MIESGFCGEIVRREGAYKAYVIEQKLSDIRRFPGWSTNERLDKAARSLMLAEADEP